MTCETTLFQLSLLLDGELEETLQKKLEGHLASCAECSQTREDLEKNEILLQDAVDSLFDSSFSETLLQQVRDQVALSKESFALDRDRLFLRNQNRFSNAILQLTAACLIFGLVWIGYSFYTEELPLSNLSSQTKEPSQNLPRYAAIPSQEQRIKQGKYLTYEEVGDFQFPLYLSGEYPEVPMTLTGDGTPQVILFHKESGKMKLHFSCAQVQLQLSSDLMLKANSAQFELFFHHDSIEADEHYSVHFPELPFFVYADSSLEFSIYLIQGEVTLQTPRKKFKVKQGHTDRFVLPRENTKGIEAFSEKPNPSASFSSVWRSVESFFQKIPISTPKQESSAVSQLLQLEPPKDFQASVQTEKLQRCYRYSIKLSWTPVLFQQKTIGYYLYRELDTGEKILLNPEKKLLFTSTFEDKYQISSIASNTYRYSIQSVFREEGKEISSESVGYTDITINPLIQFSYTGGDDSVATFRIYLMNHGVRETQTCSIPIGKFITGKAKGDLDFSTGFKLIRIYQEKQSTFIINNNGKKIELPSLVRKVELYNPETKETIHLAK